VLQFIESFFTVGKAVQSIEHFFIETRQKLFAPTLKAEGFYFSCRHKNPFSKCPHRPVL
jgi:hypothetical protein